MIEALTIALAVVVAGRVVYLEWLVGQQQAAIDRALAQLHAILRDRPEARP